MQNFGMLVTNLEPLLSDKNETVRRHAPRVLGTLGAAQRPDVQGFVAWLIDATGRYSASAEALADGGARPSGWSLLLECAVRQRPESTARTHRPESPVHWARLSPAMRRACLSVTGWPGCPLLLPFAARVPLGAASGAICRVSRMHARPNARTPWWPAERLFVIRSALLLLRGRCAVPAIPALIGCVRWMLEHVEEPSLFTAALPLLRTCGQRELAPVRHHSQRHVDEPPSHPSPRER